MPIQTLRRLAPWNPINGRKKTTPICMNYSNPIWSLVYLESHHEGFVSSAETAGLFRCDSLWPDRPMRAVIDTAGQMDLCGSELFGMPINVLSTRFFGVEWAIGSSKVPSIMYKLEACLEAPRVQVASACISSCLLTVSLPRSPSQLRNCLKLDAK